jgi:hypothetical protein
MATPQLSPGVLVREVDLTVGRADNVLDNIGVMAGPFPKGPVDEPIDIATEKDLIDVFGKPLNLDGQYEYWMSASSFLSYGGVMKIVRTDSAESGAMVNANARRLRSGEISGISTVSNSVGIATTQRTQGTYTVTESLYTTSGSGIGAVFSVGVTSTSNIPTVIVTTGGSGFATNDTITIPGTAIGGVGVGTTVSISFNITDIYTTGGISTVGAATLKIKNFDDYNQNHDDGIANYIFAAKNPGSWANNLKVCFIDDRADQILSIGSTSAATLTALTGAVQDGIGVGVTVALNDVVVPGAGSTSTFTGYLKGIVTGVQDNAIDVKIVGRVAAGSSTITPVDYKVRTNYASFRPGATLNFTDDSGSPIGTAVTLSASASSVKDWYDQQTLGLTNSTVYWRSIAPKPGTSQYVADRNGKSDEIHIVVVDDTGEITGIQGNLLEKHVGLSKAIDTVSAVNSPTKIWWRDYVARYSNYIYVGDNPSDESNNEQVSPTGFSDLHSPLEDTEGLWDQEAQDITFSALGNATYTLSGGKDYTNANPGETGTMKAELGDLITSYRLFTNDDEVAVDYLIMGPGCSDKFESQAKASELISIANQRKDCIAVISPHRTDVVDVTNPDTQTDNVLEFFSPLPSSSYAVFDTGYKYTYDRFNNKFRYIPCNADVAGLMSRTSIFSYPWFSPAGQQRGILNNAIKLAYNPSKSQRDQLYSQRINAIINQPGIGILLFGDKTGLGYASAFDRINVRRLFLTVEQVLRRSAQSQLFELNDEITRANFRNIVEPYLRDVQAKRGLYGFLVVCDSSNNTPDVIDNNEFRADIYLKPTKSINYITLTFVATRTGISFEEVAGTV